mgnify:CR=1 FL=1
MGTHETRAHRVPIGLGFLLDSWLEIIILVEHLGSKQLEYIPTEDHNKFFSILHLGGIIFLLILKVENIEDIHPHLKVHKIYIKHTSNSKSFFFL